MVTTEMNVEPKFTQFDRQLLSTMPVSLDPAHAEVDKPLRSNAQLLTPAVTAGWCERRGSGKVPQAVRARSGRADATNDRENAVRAAARVAIQMISQRFDVPSS